MMSTYELFIAILSPNSNTSSIEVTTSQRKKVLVNQVDDEANAVNETEL
jgi:hypothetical protein